MLPNKGIPGGCGIGIVIVMSAAKSISVGNGGFVEEETSAEDAASGGWDYLMRIAKKGFS